MRDMMEQPTKVEPGQVWKDLDIRAKYDEFTVIEKHPRVATPPYWRVQRGSRVTTIREDRLLAGPSANRSRGYEYIGKQR